MQQRSRSPTETRALRSKDPSTLPEELRELKKTKLVTLSYIPEKSTSGYRKPIETSLTPVNSKRTYPSLYAPNYTTERDKRIKDSDFSTLNDSLTNNVKTPYTPIYHEKDPQFRPRKVRSIEGKVCISTRELRSAIFPDLTKELSNLNNFKVANYNSLSQADCEWCEDATRVAQLLKNYRILYKLLNKKRKELGRSSDSDSNGTDDTGIEELDNDDYEEQEYDGGGDDYEDDNDELGSSEQEHEDPLLKSL
ncbi:hypothetical protein CANARDRAFT_7800 [[Candida] arabinofermentans NRRL YB-2248]|uniref:Uncharacterized protein n=1 Tax=[Candida] arabinofermentans NRRL YB-2248 TaxID=983967 RepID=A0A1E4T0B7_9ASCO|nr:hypothetical protein CANARDRAFT_7800 [[Candida] arabinofermentans NRRL YB-2248]